MLITSFSPPKMNFTPSHPLLLSWGPILSLIFYLPIQLFPLCSLKMVLPFHLPLLIGTSSLLPSLIELSILSYFLLSPQPIPIRVPSTTSLKLYSTTSPMTTMMLHLVDTFQPLSCLTFQYYGTFEYFLFLTALLRCN